MPKTTEPPKTTEVDLFAAIWQGLGSLKFAAVVLLLFTAASLLGTFIPQGEPAAAYVAAYGPTKARVMEALRLTNLYHSGWYIVLLGLIVLSTVVCTINRFKITLRRADIGSGDFTPERIRAMRDAHEFEAAAGRAAAAGRIEEELRRSGYHARASAHQDRTCIVADKGRMGNWGMFIVHASLLVIAAGAIIGAAFGFVGYSMSVAEGQTVDRCARRDYSELVLAPDPHDPARQTLQPKTKEKRLPFGILLDKFRIGVNEKGAATAYESQVRVIEKGKTKKEFRIATNRPLAYRGIRFFQNDFSMAAVTIRARAPNGDESLAVWPVEEELEPGGQRMYAPRPSVPLRIDTKDGPAFVVPGDVVAPNYDPEVKWALPTRGNLPANPGVLLLAHPMAAGMGARMPDTIGWVTQKQSQKYEGYTFSVADVTMESVLGVVYLGFATLTIGMILAFYVGHRIVRVCVWDEGGVVRAVAAGAARLGAPTFEREFAAVERATSG
jgi:cytochrome c biogenesis protein ResB